ncbi:YqeB family protein [Serinicoccus kebangsaanensis]|uniref:YqeB family protein n=1 Tax=Serinicoccus kebangsaanensis TaxID=2602069 RepID=UPI00124EA72F|nr:hypothetical protein [Serinicoccus kebangsaanensis]
MTDGGDGSGTVVGGFDGAGRSLVAGGFALAGVAAGFLLPLVAQWAAGLPWVPFQGPLELFSSFEGTWLVWGRPLIGAVLGLAFGLWVILESPVLEVRDDALEVRRYGEVQRVIPRETVGGVHRRGSKTVIEAKEGRVLFDDEIEGDKDAVRRAFVDHGYPWEGGPATGENR